MKKSTLLGICNLILVFWFSYILLKSDYNLKAFLSFYSAIKASVSIGVVLFFLLVNGYLSYILFFKLPKKPSYPILSALTFAPLFWFILVFISFSFASQPILPLLTLILCLTLYFFFRKYSKKIALFLTLGTAIVMLIVLITSFEEDYCLKQGYIMDRSGTKSIRATKDDAKRLKDFGVFTGQEIGVSFRAHMLCHNTFDLGKALQQIYLHK